MNSLEQNPEELHLYKIWGSHMFFRTEDGDSMFLQNVDTYLWENKGQNPEENHQATFI